MRRLCPEEPKHSAGDEMALECKGVVNGGVRGGPKVNALPALCFDRTRSHARELMKKPIGERSRLAELPVPIKDLTGDPIREEAFRKLLDLAGRVRHQDHRQRGPQDYSLHAPEVECIGKALHGNPVDGHTLDSILADLERRTRVEVQRAPCRKGLSRPQAG
jgi:hypothetical protein